MDLPPIYLTLDDDGAHVVLVEMEEETEFSEPAALLEAVPGLAEASNAVQTAEALNHLHGGYQYQVILEPEAFAASYTARYNEAADKEWDQEAQTLSDFALPDLSVLAPPQIADGALIYYAENTFVGLAYKAVMKLDGSAAGPDYQPLP